MGRRSIPRSLRITWLTACAAALLPIGAERAGAQTPDQRAGAFTTPNGPSERQARAREQFLRGAAAFEAGDHDTAVAAFQSAYELDPRGALLLNIAQSMRLRAPPDCEGALRHYELFLASEPYAPEREEVRGHIQAMRQCVADQRRAQAELAARAAPRSPEPLAPPGLTRALTGAGALLLLGGAALNLHVRLRYDDLRAQCPCSDARVDRWQSYERASYLVAGAGAAAALAGALLWALEPAGTEERPATRARRPGLAAGVALAPGHLLLSLGGAL